MATRYERRSKEAPMDFEWTNKERDVIPPDSPFRPAKRSHMDMTTPMPPFTQPNPATPTFGANRNVPFMFNQPIPNITPTHPWTPPLSKTVTQGNEPEINDVTMQDASPPKSEGPDSSPSGRAVATGALRRVFRARQKHLNKPREILDRRRINPDEYDNAESDDEELTESDQLGELVPSQAKPRGLRRSHSAPLATTANHNHHYTLHMPAQRLSHSDIPYLLLGYLQFFFNLSLVLGFLYLAFQFLQAVQKDVEQKMTEYSIESLHEIRACARQYEENFCSGRPSPIIMQQCQEWRECMERDASIVGRTRLFAELVGEVINGFMEPITWRTLIFTLLSLSMGIAFVNVLLIFYRARHAPVDVQPVSQPHPAPFPMYGIGAPPSYWGQGSSHSPFAFPPGSEMRRTWDTSAEDLVETPSRRRRINEGNSVDIM